MSKTRWGTPCPDPSCGLDQAMCLSTEHRKQPEPESTIRDLAVARLMRDVRRARRALSEYERRDRLAS